MRPLLFNILVICCLQGCVIPTYSGKTKLEATYSAHGTKISKVLMVGSGEMATRVFLENLSEQVIKTFANYKVTCEYVYLGKAPQGRQVDVSKIADAQKYDAYLVFNPGDTVYANLNKSVGIMPFPFLVVLPMEILKAHSSNKNLAQCCTPAQIFPARHGKDC